MLKKKIVEKVEKFEVRHKIISFLIILILTILITRIIVSISDPNIILKGFEIHHFYYGLILLIITSLLMLFRRGSFRLHLILTSISIGLIIDEILFIGEKIRGPIEYYSTLPSVIILAVIVLLIIEFIFYSFRKK